MVKFIIPITLLVVAVIFSLVYFQLNQPFKVSVENFYNKSFGEGIYYYYNFSSNYNQYSKPFNAEDILKKLLSNGIQPTDAWYKPYSSSCCPPGSKFCMEALVPPVFIIKLPREDSRVLNFNFLRVTTPHIGWCAYRIRHYIFK